MKLAQGRRAATVAATVRCFAMTMIVGSALLCACSSGTTHQSAGMTCEDSRFSSQSVDFAGTPTIRTSPAEALASFLSGPGTGLPADGYTEAAKSASLLDQSPVSSSVDPGAGTVVTRPMKYFIHRSGDSIDVNLTLALDSESWQVVQASFCADARSSS